MDVILNTTFTKLLLFIVCLRYRNYVFRARMFYSYFKLKLFLWDSIIESKKVLKILIKVLKTWEIMKISKISVTMLITGSIIRLVTIYLQTHRSF